MNQTRSTYQIALNTNVPEHGDYIQLLDAEGNPSENHATVDRWTAEYLDGPGMFIVEDTTGESFAVVRLEEYDNDRRNAWQQITTATA